MDNTFPSALTQHPKTHVPTETVQPPSSMLPPAPPLMTRSGRTVNVPIRYRTGGSLVGTNYNRVSGLKLLSYEPSERKDHAKLCLFIKDIYLIIE